MKYLYAVLLPFFVSYKSYSQQKTPVLVMCNLDARLIVDGRDYTSIKAIKPIKLLFNQGYHIIHVKKAQNILSKTITCFDKRQKAITFNFPISKDSAFTKKNNLITITDTTLDLAGSPNGKPYLTKYYTFDKGDEILFNLKVFNEKATGNI